MRHSQFSDIFLWSHGVEWTCTGRSEAPLLFALCNIRREAPRSTPKFKEKRGCSPPGVEDFTNLEIPYEGINRYARKELGLDSYIAFAPDEFELGRVTLVEVQLN